MTWDTRSLGTPGTNLATNLLSMRLDHHSPDSKNLDLNRHEVV